MAAGIVDRLGTDLVPGAGLQHHEDRLSGEALPGAGGQILTRLLLQEPGVLVEVGRTGNGVGDGRRIAQICLGCRTWMCPKEATNPSVKYIIVP
jgi:hypothetical protein